MIYLDNAATTYPKPEQVYSALDILNRNNAFNPGRGNYSKSREAFNIITECRKSIASFIDSNYNNVYFTSSATDACNTILDGIELIDGDNIYISPFEHNAIARKLELLKENININVNIIPFDKKTWKLKENELNDMFVINKPKVIFVSHVSNVTGYVLPYQKIFELGAQYESINILDAAQSFGIKLPSKDNLSFLVFAGHKSLYASFGIAGFIKLVDRELNITRAGGTGSNSLDLSMPKSGFSRYEPGSPNVVAIGGLLASCNWLKSTKVEKQEALMTEYLIQQLKSLDNIELFIPEDFSKIFGIVSIRVFDYDSNDVGKILSEDFDICVRTGYHCAPYIHDFIGSKKSNGTVRISLSYFTVKKDIDSLINALKDLED